MVNERISSLEKVTSTNEGKLSGPQVKPVDDLIQQRKKNLKQIKKNSWLKRLGVLGLTLSLSFSVWLYVKTPLSTLSQIQISGNHLLTKQEILKELQVNTSVSLWRMDLVELNERLNEIDLIQSGQVVLGPSNTLHIELIEKRGVALLMITSGVYMLSDEGEFIDLNNHRLLLNLNLPLIVGIEDVEEIHALASVLSTLNDEILVNISEIHKERTAFNEPQLRLMMQSENTIYAPISALSALDKYLKVVKTTNEKNSCFFIADLSFSLVKAECPTQ